MFYNPCTLFSFVIRWVFRLERGSDGSFSDNDLARILQDATEQRAGAFRARGCPSVMKVVEILAIEQGRKWGVCTVRNHCPVIMQFTQYPYVAQRVSQIHWFTTWVISGPYYDPRLLRILSAYKSFQEWNPDPTIYV